MSAEKKNAQSDRRRGGGEGSALDFSVESGGKVNFILRKRQKQHG